MASVDRESPPDDGHRRRIERAGRADGPTASRKAPVCPMFRSAADRLWRHLQDERENTDGSRRGFDVVVAGSYLKSPVLAM